MTPTDTEVEQALAGRIYDVLRTLRPDGNRFETDDREALAEALAAGFAEDREQTKLCPTCGSKRTAWRYFKVTQGGRLFIQACEAQAIAARSGETERLDPEGAKARSEGCAPTLPTQSGDA